MQNKADKVIDLYERHAADWDTARGRHLMERDWLGRFARLLPAGGTVLDIGCGSGVPIARHLIDLGFAVTGIDGAPAMISICQARFPQAVWHVADMRTLALGRRFDGLIAWDSFFHLTAEHQRAMLPVFAANAAPGAALMFTSGPREGEAIGVLQDEPLYHASLATDEYRRLLDAHGFAVVEHVAEDPHCGGHTVWLAQRNT
jgi:2-polyprenyl-3-methyl-5-hydroxy-6-metoxy-1,4-benzoquinol methylase